MIMEQDIKGFPSQFVPQDVKASPKYAMVFAHAFHKEHKDGKTSPHFGFDEKSDQALYRMYADGNQPTGIYKNRLSHLRTLGKGKQNLSFLTIDWSVLAVAKRFVDNIIGKILDVQMDTSVKAIDPLSVQEQQQKKYEILTYMDQKGFLEQISETSGINFDDMNPVPKGIPEPDSEMDIDVYIDLFFKNRVALEFKDLIDLGFEHNNINQVMEEYVTDLVKVGSGAIEAYLMPNGTPKLRKMIVENTITNNFIHPDGRDITRFGEYIQVPISELKELWPGQPENVYREIANHASNGKYGYMMNDYQEYIDEHNICPWDDQKTTIFRFRWKSADKTKNVLKRKKGSAYLYEKDSKWLDDVDLEVYKEKNPNNEPIFQEMQNWYGGTWVVGTKYIFGTGLQTNMLRDSTNLAISTPNVIFRRTSILMKSCKTILDSIQINWLKFNQHSQNSRVNGLSIEMSAFENISLSAGGKKIEPREALALYYETGTLLWRRKDWRSSGSQWKPVEELKNGMATAAYDHLKMCFDLINLLRDVSGLPSVADSTVPNPEIGKAVMQQAVSSVRDTMRKLFNAYWFSYSDLAKKMLELTQDSITFYSADMYKNALGIDSVKFLEMVKGINAREFSIVVEVEPEGEEKQMLLSMIQDAQKQELIDPETAFLLIQMKNPYKKLLLLKQKTRERKREMAQMESNKVNAELQKNVQSVEASTQAELQKLQAENELKKDFAMFEAQLEESLDDKKTANQVLLKRMETGAQLTANEEQVMGKIMEKLIQGQQQKRLSSETAS